MDLSRKKDRDKLAVRTSPYWQRISAGAALGFVRGPDTWRVRYRPPGRQKYSYGALGGPHDFDAAKKLAETWVGQYTNTVTRAVKRESVRKALEAYLQHLRDEGRESTADDAEDRYKRFVWDDPFGDHPLQSLRLEDFEAWRKRHRSGRSARTLNRSVRAVTAGLNLAHRKLGFVGDPQAWQPKPLVDHNEESDEDSTAILLDADQRAALLDHCDEHVREFLKAIELTGARPNEIAKAKVQDLSMGQLRLWHRKGRPPKLRPRWVVLTAEGVEFFARYAAGKPSGAYLMIRPKGNQWRRFQWSRGFRAARDKANEANAQKPALQIPLEASAYSFRHARISELLQLYAVDPITVAKQTGTSVAMIEKTYHRFIPDAMLAKLASLKESDE